MVDKLLEVAKLRRDLNGKIDAAPVPFDTPVRRKSRAEPDDFRIKC
jgi:hypothetical protein